MFLPAELQFFFGDPLQSRRSLLQPRFGMGTDVPLRMVLLVDLGNLDDIFDLFSDTDFDDFLQTAFFPEGEDFILEPPVATGLP